MNKTSIKTKYGNIAISWDGNFLTEIDLNPKKYIISKNIPPAIQKAIQDLKAYFAGQKITFKKIKFVPAGTSFQKKAWNALCKVPYGKVISYSDLAKMSGCPKASRAVGNAIGKNPLPVVIPCHRIIRKDGSLGGFGCGIRWKRILHKLEGIEIV